MQSSPSLPLPFCLLDAAYCEHNPGSVCRCWDCYRGSTQAQLHSYVVKCGQSGHCVDPEQFCYYRCDRLVCSSSGNRTEQAEGLTIPGPASLYAQGAVPCGIWLVMDGYHCPRQQCR